MKLTETTQFISPDKTAWRVIYFGYRSAQVSVGSADYDSGAIQGYIQIVIWKISIQLSVKWLA